MGGAVPGVARSQGGQGVLRGAVLRREEGGLLRTEHQRRCLRLPCLRTVLHLLALVLLPLCAGLPGVQPAGGAPRRQDGRRGLGGLGVFFLKKKKKKKKKKKS